MAGQGTRILASDYNTIQSVVANVLGTGSGTYGYGQTVSSGQVSVGNKITATQWVNLRNDLLKIRQHQTGANESGNLSAISSSLLVREYDRATFYNYALLGQTNALITPPSGQASLATLTTGTRTSAWNGTIIHQVVCNFGSGDSARYFFNSGSNIQFSASNKRYPTDGSYAKSSDWDTLLTAMGTITMNYNTTVSSTGSGSGSSIGYFNLTTNAQTIYSKTTSSPTYTNNVYDITAQINATGSIVTFNIRFEDLNAPGGYGVDENVEGTLTSTVQTYYASGSNVSVSPPAINSSGP